MDSQEVGGLLEECLRAAISTGQHSRQPTETEKRNYCSCRDSLCAELASLLQEAVDMKWPFVPEKWQYKLSVSAIDKSNLSDLIAKHLQQLLTVLKTSIVAQEASTALAVIFLVDRFLYWTDESSRLLKITRLLHRHHPNTPVAPQLVIRQARVYLNSGKLQKAEYILSSLINSSGATGCWLYQCESDRALVQAVSVQVRGMILQKLGLWLEAAELIWASLVGYYSLPQPDKKGIGTSLGILANILVSMNDKDFHAFRTNINIELESLLANVTHRLLSAAKAAKMAVIYSQYTSLYVLTNVVTQGTCLLSYSFSVECPDSRRQSFLQQAREAFEIGLLTKAKSEQVTSKQELHTFLKAAYSLAVTHKWLGTSPEAVAQATQACHRALASFYDYCHAENQDKDALCAEVMQLLSQVKLLLKVEPFVNTDSGSFIPDSYRNIKDGSVNFTLTGFSELMRRLQKYHASLCVTDCKGNKDAVKGEGPCITALGTTVSALNTDCGTEACHVSKNSPPADAAQQKDTPVLPPQQMPQPNTTLTSTDELGSSWQNFSLSSSGSSWPSSSGYMGSGAIEGAKRNQSCLTTEVDDPRANSLLQFTDKTKKSDGDGWSSAVKSSTDQVSFTTPTTTSFNAKNSKVTQDTAETLDTEQGWMIEAAGAGSPHSLSELTLGSSFSSLGGSLGSKSSWEKISLDMNSPTYGKPHPTQTGSSACLLPGRRCESSDSPQNLTDKKHTSEEVTQTETQPQQHNLEVKVNPQIHFAESSSASFHQDVSRCDVTENSTDNSYEMVELSDISSSQAANGPQRNNPLCYSCREPVGNVAPSGQYLLSQKDYRALLAGVCNECLLRRLQSNETHFQLKENKAAYSALHLKFSKTNELWTARETCVYIGEPMGMEGKQRRAISVQFLHQEERLSSYVGKDYLEPKEIQFHLKDVERQMTAQYYVTEFNKSLYDKDVMAQIFFIPSEALLILNENEVVGCVTVEPFMLGDFVKLTNNTWKKDLSFQATEYGLAFGHFTYLFSGQKEVVVDLQGWVTANGKGLTYLTDPQIHSTKAPKGSSNFAAKGLSLFLEKQHGQECNSVCQLLHLPPVDSRQFPLT